MGSDLVRQSASSRSPDKDRIIQRLQHTLRLLMIAAPSGSQPERLYQTGHVAPVPTHGSTCQ